MPQAISSLPPNYIGQSGRVPGSFDPETFEWPIYKLRSLKGYVEDIPTGLWQIESEMDNPEILPDVMARGWVTMRGTYKLDLARTIPHPHTPNSTIDEIAKASGNDAEFPHTLSLYITALDLDTQPIECTFTVGVFVGIMPLRVNAGQRFAESKYLWSHTTECDFSIDDEYSSVELPLLSTLLANHSEIQHDDGFVLCIWIGPRWETKGAFKVPDPVWSSTLRGLGRLLDRDTGDVRFVCLEHTTNDHSQEPTQDLGITGRTEAGGTPESDAQSSSESTSTIKPSTLSRKRILYAHSDILEEKSEYFRDLLTSGFSESKRYTTIMVDDASFETLYWVLRFLYTNELLFDDRDDDIRRLIARQRLDKNETTKLLAVGSAHYMGQSEWDYHQLPAEGETDSDSLADFDFDTRTVKSVSSVGTSISRRTTLSSVASGANRDEEQLTGGPSRRSSGSNVSTPASSVLGTSGHSVTLNTKTRSPSSTVSAPARSRNTVLSVSTAAESKRTSRQTPTRSAGASKASASSSKHNPTPAGTGSGITSPKSPLVRAHQHYPLPRLQSEPDPHPHPTAQPKPASALEVYMLANRYRLEALKSMAQEHLLEKMTSENCMPLAFATYRYDELHSEVLDYIVERWSLVKTSPTFLKCIQEVREDVWGECGPLVLHNVYMRL
ncbi:hypothetical protein CI109_103112 [Kwoniella shandongensis]|uniref:BTB domain-containing protein n=1 Tax=Kwoniella shandongensis TaxID=1734106 RepID=A0AAJ8LKB5_9TREE